MKKLFLSIIFYYSFCILHGNAQAGDWTWIHGSNTPNSAGNYGVQGTPSATNEPPANYEPAEWTDKSGNFWFYGGLSPSGESYNDLWRYNPTTNEWTWMNGTMALYGDPGVFGTQGVASTSNRPPSLGYAAASWVDLSGNLWLFAGYNTGNDWYYSDLWKYDVSTNEWTWVNGPGTYDPSGVYGTQGVPNAANYPRCRTECASNWTDNSGNLWLFGAGDGAVGYNDLWRYNISNNEWTWMKGVTTSSPAGVYGTQGVENAANTPGGRWSHCRWTDKSGNFYLFGGAVSLTDNFNDLWRYNPTSDNWAWMSGKSTPNDSGFYGTKCVTGASNIPWSRFENRTSWTDQNGNFWMFGGAFQYYITPIYYTFNDLWMYCPVSNQWTWESGDSTVNSVGNWGTLNVTNATNKPNSRDGAVGWTGKNGHLYMFGGAGASYPNHYNDLWEYTIDPNCGSVCTAAIIPPVALFQSSDTSLCTFDCTNFTDKSTNATSWLWTFTGGTPSTSTDENPQNICYLATGNYDVKLVASNSGASDSITYSGYIKVYPNPPTPNISTSGDTLKCSTDPSYISYQWYYNDTLLAGATKSTYVATKDGNYNIEVLNAEGCSIAVGITVILNSIIDYNTYINIVIFPNPAKDEFMIYGLQSTIDVTFELYDVIGKRITNTDFVKSGKEITVDVRNLTAGIYFVRMTDEKDSRWIGRFVKE